MKPIQVVALAAAGAVLGAVVGFGLQYSRGEAGNADSMEVTSPQTTIPDFVYPDLDGKPRHSSEWQGKILVLNFWATWCPPCREETPLFVALQDEYSKGGVQFVGVAIDEAEPAREFGNAYGVNYPILIGDLGAVALSKRLGNRFEGLPFTVVVNASGRVVLRHTGGIKREQLAPLLAQLRDAATKS